MSDKNILSISYLCDNAGVSRSGYYSWVKQKSDPNSIISQKEKKDKEDFELILEAYKYKGYNKGRRGIYMRLLHQGILMNQKKIARLMKKFNLKCPIRKANPYRRMAKAIKTSNYAPNILKRHFEDYGPRYVLLTDITYFFYSSKRLKAYLSVILDAFTKEILAHVLSLSLEVDFVLDTVNMLFDKHGNEIKTDALIHSDQGVHYTSTKFIDLVNDKNLRQSMSRRGNCWDNAPQESFFGHMKDEIGDLIKKANNFDDLKAVVNNYMDYYNNERYQYQLAKLSPVQFYEYFRTGVYPLEGLVEEPKEIVKKIKSIKKD